MGATGDCWPGWPVGVLVLGFLGGWYEPTLERRRWFDHSWNRIRGPCNNFELSPTIVLIQGVHSFSLILLFVHLKLSYYNNCQLCIYVCRLQKRTPTGKRVGTTSNFLHGNIYINWGWFLQNIQATSFFCIALYLQLGSMRFQWGNKALSFLSLHHLSRPQRRTKLVRALMYKFCGVLPNWTSATLPTLFSIYLLFLFRFQIFGFLTKRVTTQFASTALGNQTLQFWRIAMLMCNLELNGICTHTYLGLVPNLC